MKRGEIIIVEYPFTDLSGSKRRPAFVVQSDTIKSPDIVIAAISASAPLIPTRVLIEPAREPASRLTAVCVVRCENLSTIQPTLVLGAIGNLSKTAMREVDKCLKLALGLT
ncbi:MAG: type II toxin-antitoxin system PemK/MazF family toxin [Pirellulales bacterium]|nr:type II toxin-antitoxin system PemK/MazF family toxin [Pirellulales bacterium]